MARSMKFPRAAVGSCRIARALGVTAWLTVLLGIAELRAPVCAAKAAEQQLALAPKQNLQSPRDLDLAYNKPVTVTVASEPGTKPQNMVDGNRSRESAWFGVKWPCSATVDLGKTYTIDTVEHFLPQADRIYLIVGADTYAQRHRWHRFDELDRLVHWVIATRDGTPPPSGVTILSIDRPISSTALRERPDPSQIPAPIREEVVQFYKSSKERH